MYNVHVSVKELIVKQSAGAEVNQIKSVLFQIIEEVSWVRISLHDLPLEKLLKAQPQ